MIRMVLGCLFVFFVSLTSLGQNTILWKVSDTTSSNTSYLLGTFHQFGNSFVDSLPEIQRSLLKTELAIFESIASPEDFAGRINQREGNNGIEKGLKKKELHTLKTMSKDWKVDLSKLRPLEVKWKLAQEFSKVNCGATKPSDEWDHFDNYLIHLATKNGIETMGLETDSFQIEAINDAAGNPDWKKERKAIKYWLNHMLADEVNPEMCRGVETYRSMELDYKLDADCQGSALVDSRNSTWMEVLPNLLHAKSCFVTVGLAHLMLKCGLIQQLRSAGFKVEPIQLRSKNH